ncbi:MAG: hypothetical protein ACO3NZ_10280 [Pirellulales bacterium]
MTYVILAIIGILFLAALVFVGVGARGWNAGTITAAVLVILASMGYLALVSMVDERERQWRERVNSLEADVARARDGLILNTDGSTSPAGPCSLDTLQNCSVDDLADLRDRWLRQRDRVNSWRGIWWRHARFTAPENGQTGSLEITTSENPAINEGSPVYVFDEVVDGQQGTYVGAFQVTSVNGSSLEIKPLLPPDETDAERWSVPHDDVLVLESLPVDRWMAFHRTDEASDAATWPDIEAVDAANAPEGVVGLDQMETDLTELTLAGGVQPLLPADVLEGGQVLAALATTAEPPPGVDWAEVTFGSATSFTWPDGTVTEFQAGEVLPAFPASLLPQLLADAQDVQAKWVIPPGLFWAEVRFGEAYTYQADPNDEPVVFEAGTTAVLELGFAEQRVAEGSAEILRRFFRRPLTDGETELLGSDAITARVGNEQPVTVFDNLQTLGLYRIRQDLERTLANSVARTDALRNAYQNAVNQLALLDQKTSDLNEDQSGWGQDLEAAERIETSVQARHDAIDAELRETEDAIVRLGEELRQMTANVTAEIDRRTPPPDILEAPPAAGASLQ